MSCEAGRGDRNGGRRKPRHTFGQRELASRVDPRGWDLRRPPAGSPELPPRCAHDRRRPAHSSSRRHCDVSESAIQAWVVLLCRRTHGFCSSRIPTGRVRRLQPHETPLFPFPMMLVGLANRFGLPQTPPFPLSSWFTEFVLRAAGFLRESTSSSSSLFSEEPILSTDSAGSLSRSLTAC